MKKFFSDSKNRVIVFSWLIIFVLLSMQIVGLVQAETGGGAPNSGATSRIKAIYDAIGTSGLNFGSDSKSPDWGAYWNRIYTAATWAPTPSSNGAAVGDVVSGKKFFLGTDRSELTVTLVSPAVIDYSLQMNATKDNYLGTYKSEEATAGVMSVLTL